jgi:hypothetical protein
VQWANAMQESKTVQTLLSDIGWGGTLQWVGLWLWIGSLAKLWDFFCTWVSFSCLSKWFSAWELDEKFEAILKRAEGRIHWQIDIGNLLMFHISNQESKKNLGKVFKVPLSNSFKLWNQNSTRGVFKLWPCHLHQETYLKAKERLC